MIFGLEISTLQLVLLEVSLAATAVALVTFMLKTIPVSRRRARCDKEAGAYTSSVGREGASVIVYSSDEAESLERLLPQLLAQDYDAEFEVIVVNDGDSPRVREVVGDLQLAHRNLYLTHTPDGARNLSRKKLALTLGIKAARYPVAVMTTATAVIDSRRWLSLMMSHFSPESPTEIVLGFATARPDDDNRLGAGARSFDYVADATIWLADAIGGHPWRGTEHNLAYRRDLFFRSKGFSSNLNLRDGDDDIFISRVATAANTAVELSLESIVEVPGNNSPAAARQRAGRRRFTRRFIKNRPRLLAATSWLSYDVALLAAVIAAAVPPYSTATWTGAAIAFCCWYPVGLVWLKASRALCGRGIVLSLPFLAATRPLRSAWSWFYSHTHRGKRYTWE